MKTKLISLFGILLLGVVATSCKPKAATTHQRIPVPSVIIELVDADGGSSSSALTWIPGSPLGPAEQETTVPDDPSAVARVVSYNYVGPLHLAGPGTSVVEGSLFAFRIVTFEQDSKRILTDNTITSLYTGANTNVYQSADLTIRILTDTTQRYMTLTTKKD